MDATLHLLNAGAPGNPTLPLQLLFGIAALSVAPFLLVSVTAFVRIVVVLSLVRSAIGAQTLPPATVVTALALLLTFLVMVPTLRTISRDAIAPYAAHRIGDGEFARRAMEPLRAFMLRQTHRSDLALFARAAHLRPSEAAGDPSYVLVPAFVVGELRSAFAIGFAVYLPFLVIDLVISAVLMGLGMVMLSPTIVSLPVKLLLFVMVDGWALLAGSLVSSYR